MTQIVGIVCRDAIIIASESQYTIGDAKEFNGVKSDRVKFKDGNQMIVALAGAVNPAQSTIDLIKKSALIQNLESESTIAKICEGAIIDHRKSVLSFYGQESGLNPDDQDSIFSNPNRYFELVTACYIKTGDESKKAFLAKINVCSGGFEAQNHYAVSGSGSSLARFLLGQFECDELLKGEAMALAIDILERVKENDLYCGGKPRLGFVDPNIHMKSTTATAAFMPDEFTERMVEKLKKLRVETSLWHKKNLAKLMRKIESEDMRKFVSEIKAQQKLVIDALEKITVNKSGEQSCQD